MLIDFFFTFVLEFYTNEKYEEPINTNHLCLILFLYRHIVWT